MPYVNISVEVDVEEAVQENPIAFLEAALENISTSEIRDALRDIDLDYQGVDEWHDNATDGEITHMLNKILKHKRYCPRTVSMASLGAAVEAVWTSYEEGKK